MKRILVATLAAGVLMFASPVQAKPAFAKCMKRSAHIDNAWGQQARHAARAFCFVQRPV
jgi:hypothetical protein